MLMVDVSPQGTYSVGRENMILIVFHKIQMRKNIMDRLPHKCGNLSTRILGHLRVDAVGACFYSASAAGASVAGASVAGASAAGASNGVASMP
jgi:hypothetical protein